MDLRRLSETFGNDHDRARRRIVRLKQRYNYLHGKTLESHGKQRDLCWMECKAMGWAIAVLEAILEESEGGWEEPTP
jgi:hypothetical protein